MDKIVRVTEEMQAHVSSLSKPAKGSQSTASSLKIVTDWSQNLMKSNNRIFNFVLATTRCQLLCKKMVHPEFLLSSIDYLNKAIYTLNNTDHFNEYEFFNKFRNISVADIEDIEPRIEIWEILFPPPNTDTDVHEKFNLFIQHCVDFILLNNVTDEYSDCWIVQSFNEIRNLIFSLDDEKEKVFMSEISSNVFSFASYTHLNADVSATSKVAIEKSLCEFVRDYNSIQNLTTNFAYKIDDHEQC